MAEKCYSYMYGQARSRLRIILDDLQGLKTALADKDMQTVEWRLANALEYASGTIKTDIFEGSEGEEITPLGVTNGTY